MNSSMHPQKGPYLRDLSPGERFIGFYVLRNKQLESFRDPTRGVYLTLILSDRTGQMVARVWENAEETAARLDKHDIVKVDGEVEMYLDRSQIRVLRLRTANPDEYDLRDMLPASEHDPTKLLETVYAYIEQISSPYLRALLNVFFSDEAFVAQFQQVPAARRIHHAYIGGLLEHTVELLRLGERVVELYPNIHADLFTTGLILHDIGKVREFTWDFDIDYSAEGRLLGHITLTDEMVTRAIAQIEGFPSELAMRLRHMLLSHHGRYEWGSPRRPHTLEAIALHHLDNLDVQINRFHLLLKNLPEDTVWTEYDRMLGRQLYAGEDDPLSVEERSFGE